MKNQAKYEIYVLMRDGNFKLQHSGSDFESALEQLKKWKQFEVTHVQLRITREIPGDTL